MSNYTLSLLSGFSVVDAIAAMACVIAAWMGVGCASHPVFHSNERQRRVDRRFWYSISAASLLAGLYQFVGGEILVWKLGSRFIDMVLAHSTAVQFSFATVLLIGFVVAVLILLALMGPGVRRNWIAGAGVVMFTASWAYGVRVVYERSRSSAASLVLEADPRVQAFGVLSAALMITAAALIYQRRRSKQFRWRRHFDPAGGPPVVHKV